MKTGGLGGLFFSIDQRALRPPAAARRRRGSRRRARRSRRRSRASCSTCGLPDGARAAGARRRATSRRLTRAVGAAPALAAGAWADDAGDRRWTRADAARSCAHDIDHFHLPPAGLAAIRRAGRSGTTSTCSRADRRGGRSCRSSSRARWAADCGRPRWGGQVLVTLHEQGRHRRVASRARVAAGRGALLHDRRRSPGRRVARARCCRTAATRCTPRRGEDGSGATARARPRRDAGAARVLPRRGAGERRLRERLRRWPALRADASGTLCAGRGPRTRCERTRARRRTTTTTGACGAA